MGSDYYLNPPVSAIEVEEGKYLRLRRAFHCDVNGKSEADYITTLRAESGVWAPAIEAWERRRVQMDVERRLHLVRNEVARLEADVASLKPEKR